jgi:branched-chain amino acid aminotransferase
VKSGTVTFAAGQRPEATGYRVAALAGEGGMKVTESVIRVQDLLVADEVFQVGTACGVVGIVRVDEKPLGAGTEGPVTRTIREAYELLTRGEPLKFPSQA